MSKALRAKLLAATDYIEAAGPVVRVATDAPVTLSTDTDDLLPLAARATARESPNWPARYGVGLVDRPAAEGARRRCPG